MNRRAVLRGLAAAPCLAAAGWPRLSVADVAAGEAPELHRISDRFTLITGCGGNVVVHAGEQGITLVDSGLAEKSAELLTLVDELAAGAPLRRLFNTHWHPDHSGGNEALKARGARIIAHENTKLWLGADFEVPWRQQHHRPRPEAAMPDQTFYDSGSLDLGGETVEYHHYEQAHTDGDICLHFPAAKLMVAGGLLSNYRYPICDIATGGWIGGLISANAAMLELADEDTVIIPDRGPALGKADLRAQHDMLADLYETMKELAQQGYSGEDMLREAKVTANYDEVWGDPREFVLETYRGMWAHTYDMGGFI